MVRSLLPKALRKAVWLSLADNTSKPLPGLLKLKVNAGFAVSPADERMRPPSST